MTGIENVDPLGLYFSDFLHQDWMYEFASWPAAFEQLLGEVSLEGLQRLLHQIDALLARNAAELDAHMRHRSPNLNPPQDLGISDHEWLESLRARAAAELAARTAGGDGAAHR